MQRLVSQSKTVVPMVVTRIRDAILSGEIRPGQKVNQDQIALDLGVSRMPVREALIKLSEAGYVVIHPHRGAVVAEFSSREIEETYLIRTHLETLAAQLAAKAMTPERLEMLSSVLREVEAAIETHDYDRVFHLNREFHRIGYEASDHPQLCALISQLRDRSEWFRRHHSRLTERTRSALLEHRKMLEAWQKGDAEAAEFWVKVNMQNSAGALLSDIAEGR